MVKTWLGRIYDEHGRALLVERGTRVAIAADGQRQVETFAPPNQYAVLFRDQPVRVDGISKRWPNQTSNKQGDFFIGVFEIVKDQATCTLESPAFKITHPYASMLLSGGNTPATRVEIACRNDDGTLGEVLYTAVGNQSEQMRHVVADLRAHQGAMAKLRMVDESSGAWGHLNFDDFRLHEAPPSFAEAPAVPSGCSTHNVLLQHLVPNRLSAADQMLEHPVKRTLEQMYVEPGISVDLVAAEPNVHQPMAFTFDARGRLWIVEGHCYPQKRPPGQGLDRILIFADNDGDGHFATRKVFREGLNLVSGLAVGHGGVWVGAAPELLFIPDSNQDDVPDSSSMVLLDGFGYGDTHETLNSFIWGAFARRHDDLSRRQLAG